MPVAGRDVVVSEKRQGREGGRRKREQKVVAAVSGCRRCWEFQKEFARMNRSRACESLRGSRLWVRFPGGRLAQGPGEDRLIYPRPGARDVPGLRALPRRLWVVQGPRFLPPPLLSAALRGSTSGHGRSPAAWAPRTGVVSEPDVHRLPRDG